MKIFKISLFGLLLIAFTSCIDVIDVNVPDGETLLAIDGMITNQPGPYIIKLAQTAPYFKAEENPPIKGAIVELTDSEGNYELLKEEKDGIYVVRTIQGKVGNKYTLSIKTENESYKAETEIKRVPPIDSLAFEFHEKDKGDKKDKDGFFPKYFGPEYEGEGDYYRFKVYRNDSLFNKGDELVYSSDQLVDGNYIADIEFDGFLFNIKDKVRVETLAITEDAYYFYVELQTQLTNAQKGLFANPVANIRTNVINQDPNSKKRAVGYFIGAGLSFKEGYLNDGNGVIK